MSCDDLQLFENAGHMVIVFDKTGALTWKNKRARRIVPTHLDEVLEAALRGTDAMALAARSARGQSRPVPAKFALSGETWRGSLRQVHGNRLIFEEAPQQSQATVFVQLTKNRRALEQALASERQRLAAAQDEAKTLRAVAADIADMARAPLTAVERALCAAEHAKPGSQARIQAVDLALSLAHKGCEELLGIKDLIEGGFLGVQIVPLHLKPMLGETLRQTLGGTDVHDLSIDWPEDSPVLGDPFLAGRALAALVACMANPGARSIRAERRENIISVTVIAPQPARRDGVLFAQLDLLMRFANLQGWSLIAPIVPSDDQLSMTLNIPIAQDAIQNERDRFLLADWQLARKISRGDPPLAKAV